MAYLTRKKIKGITYYYVEETERINGKPRRKWQKYLGPLHKILEAVEGKPCSQPLYAEILQLGAPAAYLQISKETDMMNILDSVFSKRKQGVSVGLYLIIAAINRGIDGVSKRSMWNWFNNTILTRAFPNVTRESLSSQRFWDNMSKLNEDKIRSAWMKLVNYILDTEDIDLSCATYDGTNFYTIIGSFNQRCNIAKRGKNKQGRSDLKQVNYALFCTRKDQFPLYFDVYEGNRHDSKEFRQVLEKFFEFYKGRLSNREKMTLIFDKGNNSEENINKFSDNECFNFVGSVKVDDHKDLSNISNRSKLLKEQSHPSLEGVKAYRTKKKIYGKNLTIIVSFNENLYTAQVQSIENEIKKCFERLSEVKRKIEDRISGKITKGKKPTKESVKSNVKRILSGQHMKKLIKTTISERNGILRLSYKLEEEEFSNLSDTCLGKNIIMTNNHEWSTEEIILSYRSQYEIEDTFSQMKGRKSGTWLPMYHWTDRMIFVHGFYCSLSVLLRSLIMKKVKESSLKMSINKLNEKLFDIREVLNIFPNKQKKEPVCQSVVSYMDEEQKKLFDIFQMKQYLSEE